MFSKIINSTFFTAGLQLSFLKFFSNCDSVKIDFTFDHALKCFRYNEESPEIPIIFVPGYKGSSLKTAKHKTLWIDVWSAFSFIYTPNLSLPLTWNNGQQDYDDLEPFDVIRKVTFFKFPIADVYHTLISQLRTIGRPLYCYNYDWRRDLNDNMQRLEKFIIHVNRRHGNNGVQLIAHSMGGLVSFPIINSKPELVCSAFFISTPFGSGLNFLKDLHKGAQIAFNHKIFSPEVLASYTSHWIFLSNDPSKALFF